MRSTRSNPKPIVCLAKASHCHPPRRSARSFVEPQQAIVIEALGGGPALNNYLQQYRDDIGLRGIEIPCTLAFDAVAVSSTWLSKRASSIGNCFAFTFLPIDHQLSDLLIRSIRYKTRRVDDQIRSMKDELIQILYANGFKCHLVETDGNSGMNSCYQEAFTAYQDMFG